MHKLRIAAGFIIQRLHKVLEDSQASVNLKKPHVWKVTASDS